MFNSGIGLFEMVLIAVVALMVLGPEKFPGFAKVSVRTFRDIKKYMAEAQREITKELNPMKDELNVLKKVDVEGYVEKLIGDDEKKSTSSDEFDDMDDGEYNVEPDPSVIDDWYPEDDNEIMPGGDETAPEEKDSEAELVSDTVPYQDSPSTHDDDTAPAHQEEEVVDTIELERREEITDADNPEQHNG